MMFSTHLENFLQFSSNSKLSLSNSVDLEKSKNLLFGKVTIELIKIFTSNLDKLIIIKKGDQQ